MINADAAFSKVAVHQLLILIHHHLFWLGEKLVVKQIDHEPLQKTLQAKEHQTVVGQRRMEEAVSARREVGIDLVSAQRVLLTVRGLVTINGQNRISLHGYLLRGGKLHRC